jgi:hypothetical protein
MADSEERVREVEEKEQVSESTLSPLQRLDRQVDIAHFMLSMLTRLKAENQLLSAQIANAPEDYYSWSLEQRRQFLGAPSIECLTKTMIMENYMYREENASDPHYPRFVVVIVQYCRQISSQKVLNVMKRY